MRWRVESHYVVFTDLEFAVASLSMASNRSRKKLNSRLPAVMKFPSAVDERTAEPKRCFARNYFLVVCSHGVSAVQSLCDDGIWFTFR